jgi:hypothetical protein
MGRLASHDRMCRCSCRLLLANAPAQEWLADHARSTTVRTDSCCLGGRDPQPREFHWRTRRRDDLQHASAVLHPCATAHRLGIRAVTPTRGRAQARTTAVTCSHGCCSLPTRPWSRRLPLRHSRLKVKDVGMTLPAVGEDLPALPGSRPRAVTRGVVDPQTRVVRDSS